MNGPDIFEDVVTFYNGVVLFDFVPPPPVLFQAIFMFGAYHIPMILFCVLVTFVFSFSSFSLSLTTIYFVSELLSKIVLSYTARASSSCRCN